MSAIRPVLKSGVLSNIIRRSYHGKGDFRPISMNDLPVPTGSWKANYDAKNSKYNMHLLLGIAFATATLATAKMSGLVYLNYYPPAMPES